MANYLLRVPDDLYSQARSQAKLHGLSLRAALVLLLRAWIEGRVTIDARE